MLGLFEVLSSHGLTSLFFRKNQLTGNIVLSATRLWDEDVDFSRYNRDFHVQSLMTREDEPLDDIEVRTCFKNAGGLDYLEQICAQMIKGGHFGMDCHFHKSMNIRVFAGLHSPNRGINNGFHAIYAGGIRRHGFDRDENYVITDALNLSRAMSFKNAAGEIPFGGSKICVHMDQLNLDDNCAMGFLAYTLDSLRTYTGPDMNFTTEMSDVMRDKGFSVNFTGGPNGPIGETGKPTAFGVFWAMKEAARFLFGSDSLKGLTVAVSGLGAVGYYMAEYLNNDGAKLLLADLNPETAQKFIDEHPGCVAQIVPADEIMSAECDILCPCAVGGVINEESLPKFHCKMILGAANNQLKATSIEEELQLAEKLHARGILFQEAWWHNAGGIVAGAHEYMYGQNASFEKLCDFLKDVMPRKTRQNLENANSKEISPTQSMYELAKNFGI